MKEKIESDIPATHVRNAVFVSSGQVFDIELGYGPPNFKVKERSCHRTTSQDIACSLVDGGKKAVRVGGGYQVFASVAAANYFQNHC